MNMTSDNFLIMCWNVLNKCKEKQILLWVIGMHFVNTFKPYVDFCQSENLLRIQEIEQQ